MKNTDFKVGDQVRVVQGCDLAHGTVLSIGRTKVKVQINPYGFFVACVISLNVDHVCKVDEKVVVVNITTPTSTQGGTFVIDRDRYPAFHTLAGSIQSQCYIREYLGKVDDDVNDYFKKVNKSPLPQWLKDTMKKRLGYVMD